MGLRILVVEGNTRAARETHRAAYGLTPSESYAAVLQDIEPGLVCDIALPADEGANLPDPAGLCAYDGIVLTGSHLNVYDATPDIRRQIELMRAVFASRTPSFGSCWGLQVAAVAAGGDVRANPAGWEVGIEPERAVRMAVSTSPNAPVFATKPHTPAAAARLIREPSWVAVNITTRVAGCRTSTSAAVVTPSASGSPKSINTRSGLVASTSPNPSAAVPAVPTTSMSASALNASRKRSTNV